MVIQKKGTWQIALYIDEDLYKSYKKYLEDKFGIKTAGRTSEIRPISESLFESAVDSVLAGELDEPIERFINEVS